MIELPRPTYLFCEFWLGSQGGCGVLAKVIMQAYIAVSYSVRDMLWANENSKLGNLARTPARLCCICQGQYLPLHVTRSVSMKILNKMHM